MFSNVDLEKCCNSVLLTSNGYTSDLEYDMTFRVHGAYVRKTKIGRSSSGSSGNLSSHELTKPGKESGVYSQVGGLHNLFRNSQDVWVVSNI